MELLVALSHTSNLLLHSPSAKAIEPSDVLISIFTSFIYHLDHLQCGTNQYLPHFQESATLGDATEFNMNTHGLFRMCELKKSCFISRNLPVAILKLITYAPLPVLNSNGRAEFPGVETWTQLAGLGF